MPAPQRPRFALSSSLGSVSSPRRGRWDPRSALHRHPSPDTSRHQLCVDRHKRRILNQVVETPERTPRVLVERPQLELRALRVHLSNIYISRYLSLSTKRENGAGVRRRGIPEQTRGKTRGFRERIPPESSSSSFSSTLAESRTNHRRVESYTLALCPQLRDPTRSAPRSGRACVRTTGARCAFRSRLRRSFSQTSRFGHTRLPTHSSTSHVALHNTLDRILAQRPVSPPTL